jgi:hypothetical protein
VFCAFTTCVVDAITNATVKLTLRMPTSIERSEIKVATSTAPSPAIGAGDRLCYQDPEGFGAVTAKADSDGMHLS